MEFYPCDWHPEILQIMYRDWARHFKQYGQLEASVKYFQKSLHLKNDDTRVLKLKSLSEIENSNIEFALADIVKAYDLDKFKYASNLQKCDCIYEINQFEKNKMSLVNKSRKFGGQQLQSFNERLLTVEENYIDILGKNAGPCVHKLRKYYEPILEKFNHEHSEDKRPIWKKLADENKCDVVSIRDEKKQKSHIRKIVSIEQLRRNFTQIYFQKGWHDIAFLKTLSEDKRLNLRQIKGSSNEMKNKINEEYAKVYKCLKMLQARCPLYTKKYLMCPNEKLANRTRENQLYRVQYQTRRDVYNQLDMIKRLRKSGEIEKLLVYVEQIMGYYYEIKTDRVLPRKFEFTNEIYNIVALAYCDKLEIPDNLAEIPRRYKIFALLNMPFEKEKTTSEQEKPKFGDITQYKEPDEPDYNYIAYKKMVTKFENRCHYTKYPIERCYLYYEIAQQNIIQSKLDECRIIGRKVIEQSKLCGNYVWMFLGILMVCKSDTIQGNVEKVREKLLEAKEIVPYLKYSTMEDWIDKALYINQLDIEAKLKEDKLNAKSNEKINSSSSRRVSLSSRLSKRSSKNKSIISVTSKTTKCCF